MNEIIKIVTGNRTVRKATAALGVTLLGGVGTSMADGNLTLGEVCVTVGAALVATAAVWKADNKPEIIEH